MKKQRKLDYLDEKKLMMAKIVEEEKEVHASVEETRE